MNIAASRGCFGDCAFCFINSFYGCSARRERTVASFADEVETRLQRRKVEHLYCIDPTFIGYGANQQERVAALSGIMKDAGLPFGLETRVDTVTADIVAILAKNGATSLFLGIESGCDTVLQRINKRITKKEIVRAVRCIQESSIKLHAGFIMFDPDATIAELEENYVFLEELGLLFDHELTVNLLYHSQIVLNGSKAWQRFAAEDRLLLEEGLPFEASYRFRSNSVARVCASMKRLATTYFIRMDDMRSMRAAAGGEQVECRHTGVLGGVNGNDINMLLKNAFRSFVAHVDTCSVRQYVDLEDLFVGDLFGIFDVMPEVAAGSNLPS